MKSGARLTWHAKDPARWGMEQELSRRFMKGVESGVASDGGAWIRGIYDLCSKHGHVYDRFVIRIAYPDAFPDHQQHPSFYLESHRQCGNGRPCWRTGRDSHLEHDWRMCLCIPYESGIDCTQSVSLVSLFEHLHTFLFRQRLYQRQWAMEELTGQPPKWPGPDRAHGDEGLAEVVREHGAPLPNDPCVCGSGRPYKRCCHRRIAPLVRCRPAF